MKFGSDLRSYRVNVHIMNFLMGLLFNFYNDLTYLTKLNIDTATRGVLVNKSMEDA